MTVCTVKKSIAAMTSRRFWRNAFHGSTFSGFLGAIEECRKLGQPFKVLRCGEQWRS